MADEKPCKCLRNWAYIAPTHSGHCCFHPVTNTCHQAEVAAWKAGLDERRGVTNDR